MVAENWLIVGGAVVVITVAAVEVGLINKRKIKINKYSFFRSLN